MPCLVESINVSEDPAASIFRVLLPRKWRQYVPPEYWYLPTRLHVLPVPEDCNLNIQYHGNFKSHDLVCFCYIKGTQESASELTQYSEQPVIQHAWGMVA
jgi:hypothetical protein